MERKSGVPAGEQESPYPGFIATQVQAVSYSERYQGWQIFRYSDVQRVLSEYTTFSSDRGSLSPSTPRDPNDPLGASLISMDPPRHRHLRTLISQAFTPRAVTNLEPRITTLAHRLLDTVMDRGEIDIISDFSSRLPVLVIAELLGVPGADWETFRSWTDMIFDAPKPLMGRAMRELSAYFTILLDQRRAVPEQDLISSLLAVEVDGQRLTAIELIGNCILFLIAGNETVQNFIGNALLCLSEHPEAMQQIYEEPTLIPNALEEILRYLPPVFTSPRVARTDTVIDSQGIKAGQWVFPWLVSANRDATRFAETTTFDVHRTPNRHLSFGHGIHFCLGATLGRLEAQIALEVIFSRLHSLTRIRTMPLEPINTSHGYGIRHLPFTFTKA